MAFETSEAFLNSSIRYQGRFDASEHISDFSYIFTLCNTCENENMLHKRPFELLSVITYHS